MQRQICKTSIIGKDLTKHICASLTWMTNSLNRPKVKNSLCWGSNRIDSYSNLVLRILLWVLWCWWLYVALSTEVSVVHANYIFYPCYRMPAVLDGEEEVRKWLDFGEVKGLDAVKLLQSRDTLTFHPVSTLVNNTRNNNSECLQPVDLTIRKVWDFLAFSYPESNPKSNCFASTDFSATLSDLSPPPPQGGQTHSQQ